MCGFTPEVSVEAFVSDFRSFMFSEEATSAVEYAVVLALIVVVCIIAIMAVGENAFVAFWDVVEALE